MSTLLPRQGPGSPLLIGHRGASGYRPEHTRAAYELAFALGADAVEPDIVATKDGVLVLRHENEISATTDVASRAEFADRRRTKVVDGQELSGWFTEDFTWTELRTLRAIERLPQLRQASATFDGREGILRLIDLMELVDAASSRLGRPLVMVAELKHPTYFASIGLPLDELFAAAVTGWATQANLVVECFEQGALAKVRAHGVPGRLVFLVEASGAPANLVALHGAKALSYQDHLSDAGLARLAAAVDGVSFDKSMLLVRGGTATSYLVQSAHAAGLLVYTWTLRAENRFLAKAFRRGSDKRELGDWRGEFELILGTGVDGVFADQPDLVRSVIEASGEVGGKP